MFKNIIKNRKKFYTKSFVKGFWGTHQTLLAFYRKFGKLIIMERVLLLAGS